MPHRVGAFAMRMPVLAAAVVALLATHAVAAPLCPSERPDEFAARPVSDPAVLRAVLLDQPLSEALAELATLAGRPLRTGPGITGQLRRSRVEGTLADALDALSRDHGLVWWTDGHTVEAAGLASVDSKVFNVAAASESRLCATLRRYGAEGHGVQVQVDEPSATVRVVGPPGFIAFVETVLSQGSTPSTRQEPVSVIKFGRIAAD